MRWIIRLIPGLLLPLLLLASCEEKHSPVISVGVNPWPGYEALYIAQRQGLFAKAGLAVKLVDFDSLGDARRAFERGQIDIVASTLTELIVSSGHSARRPQAFYAIDFSNGSDMLLAKPEIKSVAQLRGKRVAAEPGSVDILALYLALKSAGLSYSDINFVPLAQAEIQEAYKAGSIDAAESYPPASSELEKMGARKIFDTSKVPGFILDVLFADAQFISERTADLHKFVDVFAEAQEAIKRNSNGEQAFAGAREGVSEAEFAESLKGVILLGWNDQPEYLASGGKIALIIENTLAALKQAGATAESVDLKGAYTDKVVRRERT